jgi:hypothetical protein
MSTRLQGNSTEFTEITEVLDNYRDLAELDIQAILQEDSTIYEITYSDLNELYTLNDKYQVMIDYNMTNPLNYTQQDFDEVKMDFTVVMRSLILTVKSSLVYEYSTSQIGASNANNYTNFGFTYYFINNKWLNLGSQYEEIHEDIQDFVNASFALSGETMELPTIQLDTWTYHLYNNLSILSSVGRGSSFNYIANHRSHIDLPLVNLSLTHVTEYYDDYNMLLDKIDSIYTDFNNTLITLALAGVLMGFATQFDSLNFRRISLIVGIIILMLSVIYFTTALSTLLSLAMKEAEIITQNGFVFA